MRGLNLAYVGQTARPLNVVLRNDAEVVEPYSDRRMIGSNSPAHFPQRGSTGAPIAEARDPAERTGRQREPDAGHRHDQGQGQEHMPQLTVVDDHCGDYNYTGSDETPAGL